MKRIVILVFILVAFIAVSHAIVDHYETEGNDDAFVADVIPQDHYSVTFGGNLSWGGDEDWFRYWANEGNLLQVTITFMQYPGVEVFIFMRYLGDLIPGNYLATIPVFDPQNQVWIYTFAFMAMASDWHYLEVHNIGMDFPNEYEIHIRNYTDPTLPVTLSGFNAVQNGEFVGVQWTTQSETDMSGYNVFRNYQPDLDNASKINAGLIAANNTSTTHNYVYSDAEVELGDTYYYWLEAVETNGQSEFFGYVQVATHPNDPGNEIPVVPITQLNKAYPNPFSSSSTLSFNLAEKMTAKLEVFNLRGQKIVELCNGEFEGGLHRFTWDGKSSQGIPCPKGVYLIRLSTKENIKTQKMVLN